VAAGGDAVEAIDRARTDGVVIERTYRQQRLIPAFMEPRSTVVDPTGEQTVMWSATQVPHLLRTMLAVTCSVPESKVRVIAPDVGGGFGGKLQVTPEEVTTDARGPAAGQAGEVHRRHAASRWSPRTTGATRCSG
jgi:carbon-monoxide dehydrogenase large subunit